jgi:Zn-dependent peptidase ImmA (M78 family)/transcriptional regulator with XRE-family HTH domain
MLTSVRFHNILGALQERAAMAIDRKELGSRLRRIRESRAYTQEDLAELLGIPRSSVVQIESGNRSVDSLELMKLSEELRFDPRGLFAEEFSEQKDSVRALFRAEPRAAADKNLSQAISKWLGLCRQFTHLEKLVGADRGLVPPVRYDMPEPRTKWEAIQQGTAVADQERSRLKLGPGPLPELPEIMESQGVRVGLLPLDDSISGLFLTDETVGLTVLVNSRHSEQRQLFSHAHEYCHLLFDREKKGVVSRLENREDQTEVRANSFAAAFLMPEGGVREFLSGVGKSQDVPTLQEVYDEEGGTVRAQRRGPSQPHGLQFYDVARLAFYFGVSYESALWRLKSLQIISEEERESLAQKQTSASAFRKVLGERFSRHRERFRKRESAFQHKLLSMALEAFRLGEITRSKLKEIAGSADVSKAELDTLLEGIDVESASRPEEVRIPS